jgi:peptidyl-prolyl cis-trans isomerase A (cyclophilin A)
MPIRPLHAARAARLVAAGALVAAAACRRPQPLLQPDPRVEQAAAPDTFSVRFETSKGPFVVQVYRDWAPRGADRFYYLVRGGFYDGVRFFRVLDGFVAQFGASGDPAVSRVWDVRTIRDDPVKQSNVRGTLTFATGGPNTRTTQLFINYRNNARLDAMGFTPIGRVIDGMARVDSLYAGYGEGAPSGRGPDQDRIAAEGNVYLRRDFPRLDSVATARVIQESRRRR